MLRVDIISIGDDQLETIDAGVGLFNGKLQCVEGNTLLVDDVLSGPMIGVGGQRIYAEQNPVGYLQAMERCYKGSLYYSTAPYEDLAENYGPDGMFIDKLLGVPAGTEPA